MPDTWSQKNPSEFYTDVATILQNSLVGKKKKSNGIVRPILAEPNLEQFHYPLNSSCYFSLSSS